MNFWCTYPFQCTLSELSVFGWQLLPQPGEPRGLPGTRSTWQEAPHESVERSYCQNLAGTTKDGKSNDELNAHCVPGFVTSTHTTYTKWVITPDFQKY